MRGVTEKQEKESTDCCIKQEKIFAKDRETERKIERDKHTKRKSDFD